MADSSSPLDALFESRTLYKELVLGFRFSVLFLAGGAIPNPLDIRFQKVSGLTATVTTTTLAEGGQNLYSHKLPDRASYENLVLTRGAVIGSPLNLEFNAAMTLFKFAPSNVLVTLLSETKAPLAVLIDTMELAYTRMQILRV
jgi:phage tail-like protein